jgi:hypothetical protein
MPEEIKNEDLERMDYEINKLIVKSRYWFYVKYYSEAGKQESLKGFG